VRLRRCRRKLVSAMCESKFTYDRKPTTVPIVLTCDRKWHDDQWVTAKHAAYFNHILWYWSDEEADKD